MKIGAVSDLGPKEQSRRISAVSILLAIIFVTALFSILHLIAGNYLLSALDTIPVAIFVLILFYIRQKKDASYIYWGIVVFYSFVCWIAISLKRENISYLFWSFLIPPAVFSLLGRRKGFILNIFIFIITLFFISADLDIFPYAPHREAVILRFIVAYAVLSFIIFTYESSQQILISYIQKEKDRFEKASRIDSLTGLSNRMDIMEKIEAERIRQLRRGHAFTLIIGDIDNFKSINDTYGHDAGDYVLKKIAGTVKEQVRGIDRPARIGGEEFLIMLVETAIDDGERAAERIRREIESMVFTYRHETISVTMTFGISEFAGEKDNVEDCIKRADQALYAGKKQGNCVIGPV